MNLETVMAQIDDTHQEYTKQELIEFYMGLLGLILAIFLQSSLKYYFIITSGYLMLKVVWAGYKRKRSTYG